MIDWVQIGAGVTAVRGSLELKKTFCMCDTIITRLRVEVDGASTTSRIRER